MTYNIPLIIVKLLLTNFLAQVHCTCTPMFLEQNAWVSLKQDARGNLVVKTPIFLSGHETRSTAIPKLGKTQILVSGHETQSNRWIFPFPPFAEGVCCERPLDVIIIPTDGNTTVRFFFQVVIIFLLVLVQINLIHFEHTKCISSTLIKTNTYPLHLRWIHTISCKIRHVIQIVPD